METGCEGSASLASSRVSHELETKPQELNDRTLVYERRILFSDEPRFSLSFNDDQTRVWRNQGEMFVDATVTEHDRYGEGSVFVWGGISLNSRTPLYIIEGTLTAQRYRDEILQTIVLPTMQEMGPGALYQDDNARPHRAHRGKRIHATE